MESKILELEKAVTKLPHKELKKFREWFEAFDAEQWDIQFEHDVKEGALNKVAEKALSDYKKGKFTEL
jgi:hypothetical protein